MYIAENLVGSSLRRALWTLTALWGVGCGSSGSGDSCATALCVTAGQTVTDPSGGSQPTGSSNPTDPTDPTATGEPTGGGPPTCDSCGADQVCVQGACTDVPEMCPCPLESYCDLGSGKCVIGCAADENCDEGRICDPTNRECFVGCREDPECGAGKICEGLQCTAGCREDTDCAAAEICDGVTCRLGCNTTDECPAGQICDATVCREGCTGDGECGAAGEICDDTSKVCRAGCRADGECPLEQICDEQPGVFKCKAGCTGMNNCGPGKLCTGGQCVAGCLDQSWCSEGEICKQDVCVAGCLTTSDCGAGKICEANVCVAGCESQEGCPLGQYCHEKKCIEGCGPPGGATFEGQVDRCPAGTACVPHSCQGDFDCKGFECQVDCYFWECASSADKSYACLGTLYNNYCMQTCSKDADCPNGKVCAEQADPPDEFGHQTVQACRTPCQDQNGCYDMYVGAMGVQNCDCVAGKCTWNNSTQCEHKKGQMP
jgi:hypothetical protein